MVTPCERKTELHGPGVLIQGLNEIPEYPKFRVPNGEFIALMNIVKLLFKYLQES